MAWSTQKKLSLLLLRSRDDHNNPFFALKLFSFDYLKKKKNEGSISSQHIIYDLNFFLNVKHFRNVFRFVSYVYGAAASSVQGLCVYTLGHWSMRLCDSEFLYHSWLFLFLLVLFVGWFASSVDQAASNSPARAGPIVHRTNDNIIDRR